MYESVVMWFRWNPVRELPPQPKKKKKDWHTKRPVIKKKVWINNKKNHTAKQTKQKKISNNNNIVNWEKRTEKIDITFDTNKMCVCVSIWLARKIRSFQEFHM